MARQRFDVVVVGARCAGAALAMFLARSGVKVLLIDKNPLPSDQVLSTHTIHPPREFLGQGRRIARYRRVLKERTRLLEATRVGTAA